MNYIPWPKNGLIMVRIGQLSMITNLHGHSRCITPQEPLHQRRRSYLRRRRTAPGGNQLVRWGNYRATKYSQHVQILITKYSLDYILGYVFISIGLQIYCRLTTLYIERYTNINKYNNYSINESIQHGRKALNGVGPFKGRR